VTISLLTRVLCIVVLLQLPVDGQTGPISMDRFGEDRALYMLDESGRIFVSEASQINLPIRFLARVPSSLKALDILSAKIWVNRELIFVTAYGLMEDSRPRLIQYSVTGQQQCEWILPEISTGLDIDSDNHTIYLAGSISNTVYGLKLLKDTCYGTNQLKPVIQVKNARRLGPLVIDSKNHICFVADILKGSLYKLDLNHGGYIEIVRALGQPIALLYDGINSRVYAADAAGRRIWRIEVHSLPTIPDIISRDAILEEPSSLAFTQGGRILVGDRRAKSFFFLNDAGRVVSRVAVPVYY
jgi:hypothetical protein